MDACRTARFNVAWQDRQKKRSLAYPVAPSSTLAAKAMSLALFSTISHTLAVLTTTSDLAMLLCVALPQTHLPRHPTLDQAGVEQVALYGNWSRVSASSKPDSRHSTDFGAVLAKRSTNSGRRRLASSMLGACNASLAPAALRAMERSGRTLSNSCGSCTCGTYLSPTTTVRCTTPRFDWPKRDTRTRR